LDNSLEKTILRVTYLIMKIVYRVWFEKDDVAVFGKGVKTLLDLVDETGSLHRAAERLNMSYRAAWGRIRQYEKRLGITLIDKGRHGRTGAKITPEGRTVMKKFNAVEDALNKLIDSAEIKGLFESDSQG